MSLKTFPIYRDAPPVVNVAAGQMATLDLSVGQFYYSVRLIGTVTKSAAAATEPTLDEAIGPVAVMVNSDPKRSSVKASYINAIQTAWRGRSGAKLYSKTANDLITATTDGSANSQVQRTSTWVLDIMFAEPSRDSYTARKSFGWPTVWNNKAIGGYPAQYTANIQLQIMVPSGSSLSNPAMRAEFLGDARTGPLVNANLAAALQAAGIVAPAAGTPIMPVTHWYFFPEDYSSTAIVIRKWPFTGGTIQELDLFCQSGDDVASFELLTDNSFKRKTTKASSDQLNEMWGWNDNYGTGTAGNTYPAADLCAIALDFTDDPGDALSTADFRTLELRLTLTQAAASNKSIGFIAQVYRNALLL